jgi:hypothetical protein
MGIAPSLCVKQIKRRVPAMGMFKPTEWADLNPKSNAPESSDKDMRPSNGDLPVILLIDIGGIGSAPEKLFRSRRPVGSLTSCRARFFLLMLHTASSYSLIKWSDDQHVLAPLSCLRVTASDARNRTSSE